MNFLIQLVIALALAIIFKPKFDPVSSQDQKPELPTNDETRKIQVVYGTVLLKSAGSIWGGRDFRVVEKTESGGLLGPDIPLGTEYYISFAMALSFGKVGLKKIYLNDALAWQAGTRAFFSRGDFSININKPDLFLQDNDPMPRNGFVGTANFYSGDREQGVNPWIAGQEPLNTVPAWKDLSYIVFKRPYYGNSRRVPTPSFEVERLPQNITDGDDYFIETSPNVYECNPVEIIYDVMSNRKFGVNINAEQIDEEAFKEAGRILKEEGFGLSLILENGNQFDDIRKDIEKHVSCNIFFSNLKGKWTIKLNRQDYDVNNILQLNENNITGVRNIDTREIVDLATDLKINYTDRTSDYTERTISANSQTILRARGSIKVEEDNFLACHDRDLAAKIISREIKAYITPLISLELLCNREAFGLQIGDVTLVNYPRYKINNIVFRITEVDYGTPNDNKINVKMIQDIFSFGEQFIDINDTTLNEQPTDSDLIFNAYNFEAPIFFGENHTIISCLEDHNTRSRGFSLYIEEDTERLLRATSNSVTSFGILSSQIYQNDTTLYISSNDSDKNFNLQNIVEATTEQRLLGKNFAVLTNGTEQEFISFRKLTVDPNNDRYIIEDVWRGGLDTIPKFWTSSTTKIYFLDYGAINAIIDNTKTDGIIKTYDIDRRFTTKEAITYIDNATIQFTRRFDKPLYPYLLKINNFKYGTNQTTVGSDLYSIIPNNEDLQLTWGNADRSNSNLNFNYFNNPTSTNEANTIYNLRIYDDNDTLIKTENGLTSQNYTFTDETLINPNLTYYNELRFELETERDGILSKEMYNVKIIRQ